MENDIYASALLNFDQHFVGKHINFFFNLGFDEFQNLLTKQAPIEGYTEWLDNIIDKCVLQVTNVNQIIYYKAYVPLSMGLINILIIGAYIIDPNCNVY